MIVSRSPKNFSASDIQKVSPSLMPVSSFPFLMWFLHKTATVILYFLLQTLFVKGLAWLDSFLDCSEITVFNYRIDYHYIR